MKRLIYMLCGFAALSLGIAGIVLPIIPSTPLFMLALFCFTKGSTKIANWFLKTWPYKKYIKKYADRKGMTLKQKLSIQIFASLIMLISFILINQWILRCLLLLAVLIHNYIFIFKIKTFKDDNKSKSDKNNSVELYDNQNQ